MCGVVTCNTFLGNLLLGIFTQTSAVALFDISTQQTYPVNETFVGIILTRIVTPIGLIFGAIGRVIFRYFCGLGVVIFQSANLLLGVALTCLF